MKQLLSLALLSAFAATIVGCQASGDVGDPDMNRPGKTTVEKSTERDANGDLHTKTETHHEMN